MKLYELFKFTFHNVSINTLPQMLLSEYQVYLHSTMFLLIPIPYNRSFYNPNLTTFCQPCHFIII